MKKTLTAAIKTTARVTSTLLIATILVFGHMHYHLTYTEDPDIPKDVSAEFLELDIYVNGRHYNNWNLERPFLIYAGRMYAPVDENYDPDLKEVETMIFDLTGMTVKTGVHRKIDGVSAGLNTTLLNETGQEYIALEFLKEIGRMDVEYDSVGGLYISTDKGVSAKTYLEKDTNKNYIAGIVAYMIRCNPDLSEETAQRYEYLIRHACEEAPPCTEDLVISIIRLESNFNHDIGTNAVGMMQVLHKYASKKGYTREDLEDPHINIHYGCSYLARNLNDFRGNEIKALTAYNKGPAALFAEDGYDTSYANSVLASRAGLIYWLQTNGYPIEFQKTIDINDREEIEG